METVKQPRKLGEVVTTYSNVLILNAVIGFMCAWLAQASFWGAILVAFAASIATLLTKLQFHWRVSIQIYDWVGTTFKDKPVPFLVFGGSSALVGIVLGLSLPLYVLIVFASLLYALYMANQDT